MSTSESGTPYHHGNLRQALLDSAREILTEDGVTKLSLRGVARHAGVSQTAPYRHFKDKAALLAALATEGFRDLTQALTWQGAGREGSAARMAAMGRGYVGFATQNKAIFLLMFGPEIPDKGAYPELCAEADAAFAVLANTTADGTAKAGGAARGAPEAALAAWSLVHGLATLLNDGQIKPEMFGRASLDPSDLSNRLGRFLDFSKS
jgi:AcrR family transcriptional regulator